MHVFHHIVMRALHELSEPAVELLADSLTRELVALQTTSATRRGILLVGGGVAETKDADERRPSPGPSL